MLVWTDAGYVFFLFLCVLSLVIFSADIRIQYSVGANNTVATQWHATQCRLQTACGQILLVSVKLQFDQIK